MKGIIIKFLIFVGLLLLLSNFSVFESKAQDKERDKERSGTGDKFLESIKSMQIAYVSKGDIWVMRGDGLDKRRITKREDVTILFGWSYDDTRLLFGTGKLEMDPDGNYISGYKLWTIEIKTGKVMQALRDKEAISFAEWSPKEDKIVFLDKSSTLWIIRRDGSGLQKLEDATVSQPVWSPYGTKIAYVITPPYRGDAAPEEKLKWANVWVIDAALMSKIRITEDGINQQPMWLLDGSQIVIFKVTGKYGTGEHRLYDLGMKKFVKSGIREVEVKTDADKENFRKSEILPVRIGVLQRIYQSETVYFVRIKIMRKYSFIGWSSDYKKIAFVATKGEIYIGDSNGENLTKVAENGDYPVWSKSEVVK